MGGFGSGRWDSYAKKRTVEDCWILDLAIVVVTVQFLILTILLTFYCSPRGLSS